MEARHGDGYGDDIYTEADSDPNTLANLGPLAPLAGTWTNATGADVHPVGPGSDIEDELVGRDEHSPYVERYDLQPIDPQTNGPQLFYGLRYHTHIVRPGEIEMFHDQVGYWLWEPATSTVVHSLTIPRGQAVLAGGEVEPDATSFTLRAERGSTSFGIVSNPFLERAFLTERFTIEVTVHDDGTWSYEEHTWLRIPDRPELVDHSDEHRLTRIAPPTPNPLAAAGG